MEKLKHIKGALFDLDGTLLDSTFLWYEIDRRFLSKRGIAVPADYAEAVNALGFRAAAEYTVKRFSLDETPESLMKDWNDMAFNAYSREIGLKSGAEEFLRALIENGVRLGVVTALSEELYTPCLKNNGIYGLFDCFVSLKHHKCGKEVPDAYLTGARELDLKPSECAVFEDIAVGIRSAKQGGFIAVGVYDPSSEKDREQIKREADYYIENFGAAIEAVKNR